MSNKEDFLEEDFLIEMFNSCFSNKTICDIVIANVKYNFLPDESQKKLLKAIRDSVKDTRKLPTIGGLKLFFRKDHDVLDLLSNIRDLENKPDEEQLLHSLQQFIKESKFSELLVSCADTYNLGDKKKAFSMFSKGGKDLELFSLSASYSESVFADFETRNIERILEAAETKDIRIPTCIDELDNYIHGGFEIGELIMWLAQSKGGKSFCLAHLGVSAARLGFGVLHFQAEGTKKQCLNRFDSLWTGTTYYEVKDGKIPDSKYESLKKVVANIGRNDIHVVCPEKFDALTMVDIRKKVIEMKKLHDIKVVIIDYMDLISPGDEKYSPSEERQKLQRVNRMMKELAVEQQVLIHTATQASSVSDDDLNDVNFVMKRQNLSEDKSKVNAVDGLISINKTSDERKNKVCRLHADALREHDSGFTIYIKQNLQLSKFYDRKNTLREFFEMN